MVGDFEGSSVKVQVFVFYFEHFARISPFFIMLPKLQNWQHCSEIRHTCYKLAALAEII